MESLKHIIISRTDSIGDVMLTLPLAKILKDKYPQARIYFLGKQYTASVIACCSYVDAFLLLENFMTHPLPFNETEQCAIIHVFPVKEIATRAKALKIKFRIGTTNRIFHWFTCNKLVRLSRKNAEQHEAQLNTKLLKPLDIHETFSKEELGNSFGFTQLQSLQNDFLQLLDTNRKAIILHPKSQGSAREWGIANFIRLIQLIDKKRYQIFISGTEKEKAMLNSLFQQVGDDVTDITGLMNLSQFIAFINQSHALVANSTGPLHLAAALGKKAIGIYPPIRPMHPGRWAPIGKQASYFVVDKNCSDCRKSPANCSCISSIRPNEIIVAIEQETN